MIVDIKTFIHYTCNMNAISMEFYGHVGDEQTLGFSGVEKTGITLFGHSDILCRPLTLFKTKLEKNTQTCEKQSVSFHDEIQTDTVYAF